MNLKNYEESIQIQLKRGEINSAIDLLLTYLQKSDNHISYNHVLLIKSKWVNTEKEYKIIGSISRNEYDISFSKTIHGIQEIMNEVAESNVTNLSNRQTNNLLFFKKYAWTLLLIPIFLSGLYYWKQIQESINTENQSSTEIQTKTPELKPPSEKKKPVISKISISPSTIKSLRVDKDNKMSTVETKLIGVNFLDDNGENDNVLTEKIVVALTNANQSFAIADKYQIKNYAKVITSQLTINKTGEKEIFKTKVLSYNVKLVFQYIDIVNNKPCAERKFNNSIELSNALKNNFFKIS